VKIDLAGKIAVVTGSAGELGRVMALTLAECGADVALHYHSKKGRAEEMHAQITELGQKACVVQADITDRSSIEAMRAQIEETLGGSPDILVNNAISGYTPKPILEQPPEDYISQFTSSAVQSVLMAQVFVPAMIAKKWGRIIAISTEVVVLSHAGQSAYAAGKRGLDGVLRVLAKEIGEHQITVNQVAPGWMISERDRAAGTQKQEHYDKHVPLRHRGEDRDIANAVAFLASDLARFISGVFLPVCGGNIMPGI
jgi:3-oxoacyl-[acyl-carrier protein] reductase